MDWFPASMGDPAVVPNPQIAWFMSDRRRARSLPRGAEYIVGDVENGKWRVYEAGYDGGIVGASPLFETKEEAFAEAEQMLEEHLNRV